MSKTTNCLNCESDFDGAFHYCPNCGQKSNDELTLTVLFNNTISNYFSIDARFFKSFIPLMLKPGVVARRFVDGKRLQYLHPAQFYLFVSVVFFFLFSLATRQQQQGLDNVLKKGFESNVKDNLGMEKLPPEDAMALKEALAQKNNIVLDSFSKKIRSKDFTGLDSIPVDSFEVALFGYNAKKNVLDSLIRTNAQKEDKLALFGITEKSGGFTRLMGSQFLKIYEQRGGGILKSFYDTIPIAMFFLLPVFALLLKILYYKRGLFAHHMVFSFYYFTFMFIVLSFMVLLSLLTKAPIWVDAVVIASTLFYLILALRKFYVQSIFATLFKTAALWFSFMLVVLPLTLFFVVFISFLLY